MFHFVLYLENIWIVGDSIIHWAAHYLLPWGEAALNLHLPHRVTWKGLRGAHLWDLPLFIFESLSRNHCGTCPWPCRHAPTFVVLHVGTNDLISIDLVCFKHMLVDMVAQCRSLLPYSTLIWSDILPRHWYQGARSQSSVELKRKTVNKTARAIVLAGGGKVIKHANINWASRSLFRDDYLHLDILGQFLFTNNLREALHFFYRFPGALVYQAESTGINLRWGKFASRQINLPQDKFVWPLVFLFAYKQK